METKPWKGQGLAPLQSGAQPAGRPGPPDVSLAFPRLFQALCHALASLTFRLMCRPLPTLRRRRPARGLPVLLQPDSKSQPLMKSTTYQPHLLSLSSLTLSRRPSRPSLPRNSPGNSHGREVPSAPMAVHLRHFLPCSHLCAEDGLTRFCSPPVLLQLHVTLLDDTPVPGPSSISISPSWLASPHTQTHRLPGESIRSHFPTDISSSESHNFSKPKCYFYSRHALP